MSDGQGQGKKRNKSYYVKAAKKGRRIGRQLESGMTGFLLTCNNREREAVREAYSILNEYAERLYGPEKPEGEDATKEAEEEDIEDSLAKELGALKESAKSTAERRFQVVDSGANNCIFIKTTLEDPAPVLNALYADVHATQQTKSRYIMRFWPVIRTCRADYLKIGALAEEFLPRFFKDCAADVTYSINVKVRNNNQMGRMDIIRAVGDVIQAINGDCAVDFDNPTYVIGVDILRAVCCFSVLTDFHKMRKYNVQEVAAAQQDKTEHKSKVEEGASHAEETVSGGGSADKGDTAEEAVSGGGSADKGDTAAINNPDTPTEVPDVTSSPDSKRQRLEAASGDAVTTDTSAKSLAPDTVVAEVAAPLSEGNVSGKGQSEAIQPEVVEPGEET